MTSGQLSNIDQFRSIHNSAFIGFDELFNKIQELQKPQGFPPYDIVKESDDEFGIKMAVAGYKKDNISVVLENGKLTISASSKQDESATIYLYKGIAERDFKRVFTLADTVQVKKVTLSDGMLYINLLNVIPEHQKPKTFEIN